jgi:solute:Na+ symporter, SSS family
LSAIIKLFFFKNLLLFFIIIYLIITVAIGFLASGLVKNAEDFILAGRRLPLILSTSALFATWFGSETILGASSEFIRHGLYGVIEDPFGAALCLLLVGLIFARPLYRMNILTFGDFYRIKFNRNTEIISSFFMIASYFGWIAAQLVALGIILNVISGLPVVQGIIISALIVSAYTFLGGLWAISVTDFLQTIVIIVGLTILATTLVLEAGGFNTVFSKVPEGFLNFFLNLTLRNFLLFCCLDYNWSRFYSSAGCISKSNVSTN